MLMIREFSGVNARAMVLVSCSSGTETTASSADCPTTSGEYQAAGTHTSGTNYRASELGETTCLRRAVMDESLLFRVARFSFHDSAWNEKPRRHRLHHDTFTF